MGYVGLQDLLCKTKQSDNTHTVKNETEDQNKGFVEVGQNMYNVVINTLYIVVFLNLFLVFLCTYLFVSISLYTEAQRENNVCSSVH